MRSGSSCGTFLAAQGVDLAFVKDTAEIHTGTAIITIADADNTIVVVPGANALVSAEDVAAPVLAKGDVAVSQFEIPLATIAAFFKRARAAGATTILNPAPAIACRAGVARSRRHPDPQRDRAGVSREHRASRYRRPCPFHRSRAAPANRRGQNHLRHAGQARRARACRRRGLADCRPCREGRGHHRRRRLLRRRRSPRSLPMEQPIRDALDYANAAASICVQRMGAAPSMPTAAEVDEILAKRA